MSKDKVTLSVEDVIDGAVQSLEDQALKKEASVEKNEQIDPVSPLTMNGLFAIRSASGNEKAPQVEQQQAQGWMSWAASKLGF